MKLIGVNYFLNGYRLLNWDICPALSKLMVLCSAGYSERNK